MKSPMKNASTKLAVAILFGMLSVSGCAQKGAMAKPEGEMPAANAQAMPPMNSEEMMAKMKEAATPDDNHEKLKPLVGKWKTEAKMWMEPGKEPQVTKGTSTAQWILGKRFLKEDFSGKFHGQPFQGTGTLGYDKVKKKYVSTWIDSMGTGIMQSEGTYDDMNKSIGMSTSFFCPATGGEKKGRTVTRIISNKEHVFEMYDIGPDGKEMKVMEITYKRIG